MHTPTDTFAMSLRAPNWHAGRALLQGPPISVSGRQILLGTLLR